MKPRHVSGLHATVKAGTRREAAETARGVQTKLSMRSGTWVVEVFFATGRYYTRVTPIGKSIQREGARRAALGYDDARGTRIRDIVSGSVEQVKGK